MNLKIYFELIILSLLFGFSSDVYSAKIIGLMQVRNEEFFIEQTLRALACYADSIIIVDDVSTDNTVKIIKSLEKELNIEKIILNKENSWQTKGEAYNKQLLLDAGRQAKGTHFIFLDADEIFSSFCLKNNWLRNQILAMNPGQVMVFKMINLWDGIDYYRVGQYILESSHWARKPRIICDDGICNYNDNNSTSVSNQIHILSTPQNIKPKINIRKEIYLRDLKKAIIHLNAININRIIDKRIWYMCFEFIKLNEKSNFKNIEENTRKINESYGRNKEFFNLEKIKKDRSLKEWLEYYNFFNPDVYKKYDKTHRKEVISWIKKYGYTVFKDLNIWQLDWTKKLLCEFKGNFSN